MSEKYTYIDTRNYITDRGWIEKHEIFDAGLNGGARLHRFKNRAGDDYSAIYLGDAEQGSQVRSLESAMIEWWNGTDEKFGAWGYLCENPLPPL